LRILNSTSILVRKGGVEPPRPRGHRILSPARLPIPPLPQERHPALGSLFWRQVASFGPEVAGGTADAFPLDNQSEHVHLNWLCWTEFFFRFFRLARIVCPKPRRFVSASTTAVSTARLRPLFSRAFTASASTPMRFSATPA